MWPIKDNCRVLDRVFKTSLRSKLVHSKLNRAQQFSSFIFCFIFSTHISSAIEWKRCHLNSKRSRLIQNFICYKRSPISLFQLSKCWFFQKNFGFLTSHIDGIFFLSFKKFCYHELKIQKVIHMISFFTKLYGFEDRQLGHLWQVTHNKFCAS